MRSLILAPLLLGLLIVVVSEYPPEVILNGPVSKVRKLRIWDFHIARSDTDEIFLELAIIPGSLSHRKFLTKTLLS
jgi:hypothetical protein